MAEELLTLPAAIERWSDEQLACRSLVHSWQPYTAQRSGPGWEQVHRCPSCRAKRRAKLDARGRLLSTAYDYSGAKGYRIAGLGHLDRDQRGTIRLAAIHRLFPAAQEETRELEEATR